MTARTASRARAQSSRLTSEWVTSRISRSFTGLNRRQPDPRNAAEPLGQETRVGVIGGELRRVLLEGDQTGGSQHPGLAHPAAEHFAYPQSLVDEGPLASQQRSHWSAQPLRQARHHRVERGGHFVDRPAQIRSGVEGAGAIQVHGQADLVSPVADLAGYL